jgi:hypothetical protein
MNSSSCWPLFVLSPPPSYTHRPIFGLRLVCKCSAVSSYAPKNYFCMQKIKNHPLTTQKPCHESGCTRSSEYLEGTRVISRLKGSISTSYIFSTIPTTATAAACIYRLLLFDYTSMQPREGQVARSHLEKSKNIIYPESIPEQHIQT